MLCDGDTLVRWGFVFHILCDDGLFLQKDLRERDMHTARET